MTACRPKKRVHTCNYSGCESPKPETVNPLNPRALKALNPEPETPENPNPAAVPGLFRVEGFRSLGGCFGRSGGSALRGFSVQGMGFGMFLVILTVLYRDYSTPD